MSSDELGAVYRANGDMHVQIVRGRLEASGIPCLLRSQAAPSVHAFAVGGMGEVFAMVAATDAEESRKLVAEND